MAALDHWHPVLPSNQLGTEPLGIKLAGTELALFRTRQGKLGAVVDCCPHRRMRLSRGKVLGERLQCPYHGWTFDCRGRGESPGTPRLHAQVEAFSLREER